MQDEKVVEYGSMAPPQEQIQRRKSAENKVNQHETNIIRYSTITNKELVVLLTN